MSNDDNDGFAKAIAQCQNAHENMRANLAHLPRGHVFREVTVQLIALGEAWTRVRSLADASKQNLAAMRLIEREATWLVRLTALWCRWYKARLPQPDHYAPRFLSQIDRMRKRFRAEGQE
jgi:hypothetical protein